MQVGLSALSRPLCQILPLATLVACLSGEGGPPQYEPPDCPLRSKHYLVEQIDLAQNLSESIDAAFDLDGDAQPDNTVASILASATRNLGSALDFEAGANDSVADRRALWVVTLSECPDGSHRELSLGRGEDRDDDGRVEVADSGEPATEVVRDRQPLYVHGMGEAPLSIFFDPTATSALRWGPVYAVSAESSVSASRMQLRLGFGMPGPLAEIVAQAFLTSAMDDAMVGLFDVDDDGTVTVEEIEDSSLVQSTFGNPDIDLLIDRGGEQVYWPRQDGILESVSFAARLSAVEVETE